MKSNLLILLVLLLPLPAMAASPLESILGYFDGQIVNGGEMQSIRTQFMHNTDGEYVGRFAIQESDTVDRGLISHLKMETPHLLSLQWQDKYGRGIAQLRFSSDYCRFQGFWGLLRVDGSQPWYGVRPVINTHYRKTNQRCRDSADHAQDQPVPDWHADHRDSSDNDSNEGHLSANQL